MASTPLVRRVALALTLASTTWLAAPATAAPHRARLGSDLERRVTRGDQAIDVIVHGSEAEVTALARRYNLRVRRLLRNGAVLGVTAGQLDAVAQDPAVDHLASDADVHSSSITTEAIGADQVLAGLPALPPISGAGIGVAVIDSGIDTRHPALRNRVVYTKDYLGGDGSDAYGHGTHVGALIAGRAGQAADTAAYMGVAPAARLINLRVLDANGAGRASDVIDAIDWAIENRQAFNIRIINLSLGAPVVQSYKDDPLCEAVERAVSAGLVVVAAAGNYGVTKDGALIYGGITAPGNDPAALTVGALDLHDTSLRTDDTLAKYSSKGPSLYDLVLKPDLVAPGSRLVSAEAAGSTLALRYPEKHVAGSGTAGYMQLSGTSMAAAVASGAAALLLDERPRLNPSDVKLALQLTSSHVNGEGFATVGAGSLNSLAAAKFVAHPRRGLPTTTIGGASVQAAGVAFVTSSQVQPQTIVWGGSTLQGGTIVWGGAAMRGATIVWGTADTIVWGGNAGDASTIVWGGSTTQGSTIVWGGSALWGNTIVWGEAATIVWGEQTDYTTIVWGGSVQGSTIVWGEAALGSSTIVWGEVDTIVWGG